MEQENGAHARESESLNIISDAWIPVRRRSGRLDTIRPSGITSDIETDAVVAVAWPRPELNGATLQLLVGILSSAGMAADHAEWVRGWNGPPPPEELDDKLANLAPHFEVVADGPAFLQDLDPLIDTRVDTPGRLLFDTPGRQTERHNTDLFRKRLADDTVLSLPAAAIALYARMIWCASGGKGHRVALAGGGPLVTLPVLGHPRCGETLWGRVWPSVHQPQGARAGTGAERIFAWLGPTRTSEAESETPVTGPEDMHPLHAHWSMPRRIRLVVGPGAGRACAVTGETPAVAVVAMRMRNYGMNYASGYPHPNVGTWGTSEKTDPLPLLATMRTGACGRMAGLLCEDTATRRMPAAIVGLLHERVASAESTHPRLLFFGIDADKAKTRGWTERTITLAEHGLQAQEPAVVDCLQPLSTAVAAAAGMLTAALKRTAPSTAGKRATERLSAALQPAFEAATAAAFGTRSGKTEEADPTVGVRARFARAIQGESLLLFDELAPAAGVEHRDPFKRAAARETLVAYLSGRTKGGRKLYAETLLLPIPTDAAERPEPRRTPPRPSADDESAGAIAWHWRATLDKSAGAADKARLNHAHSLAAAAATDAAKRLAEELAGHTGPATAALVAVALAATRADSGAGAAEAAGRRQPSGTPPLPPHAFRAVLEARGPGLLKPLKRLLESIPDRRADRRKLAEDLIGWNHDVRQRWTNEYCAYRTAPDAVVEHGE